MAPVIALLVNPTSGRGRGRRLAAPVAARLRAAGVDVAVLIGPDATTAAELARSAVARGADVLAVVGGDGMVHLAVQAVAGTGVSLGIVPAGTGDDIAAALGIPVRDPDLATDALLTGRVRAVDAVRAGDRWYAGVLAAGLDSAVNERANRMAWPRGRFRYDLALAVELAGLRPLPFTLGLDGVSRDQQAVLVAVGNTPGYGGGMLVCPDARLDDGLLDVTVVGPISRRQLVRVFPRVYRGTHVDHPAVTVHRARTVTLAAPGVVAYADGERLAALPLTCEAVPGALRVLVPGT